jgi:hypothetical protein
MSFRAGQQRVTQQRYGSIIGFKPNNTFDNCSKEIRTDSISNQLSEEGLRKEIAAAVGWLKGC